MFLLRLFLIVALALGGAGVQAAARGEDSVASEAVEEEAELMHRLMTGYLVAAHGDVARAARMVGDLGVAERNAAILESATRYAILAKDAAQARRYADAWVKFGGGVGARQVLAELYIRGGRFDLAEPLLAELMAAKAQSPGDLSLQLMAARNAPAALAMGRRLFSDDGEGRYQLARLALAYRDPKAALAAAAAGRRAAPERLDLLFVAARAAQAAGDDEAPLRYVTAFVESGCGGRVAHCSVDALLWAMGDYLRGGKAWREGLDAKNPDKRVWAVSAGHWYEQWRRGDEARAAYRRGGALFEAAAGRARLKAAAGDVDGALAILQGAEVARGEEFALRENAIGRLLMQSDRLPQAIARLSEALKTLPENFSLLYFYSVLLEQDGDVAAAVAVLRRITHLFPSNPDGWNALGYVLADHNMSLEEAQGFILRALKSKPNDPHVIDSMGWLLYRQGNLAAAQAYLMKAAELSDAAEIHAHYGEVLWEAGNTGEAVRVWRQAVARHPNNKLLNETLARYNPF